MNFQIERFLRAERIILSFPSRVWISVWTNVINDLDWGFGLNDLIITAINRGESIHKQDFAIFLLVSEFISKDIRDNVSGDGWFRLGVLRNLVFDIERGQHQD